MAMRHALAWLFVCVVCVAVHAEADEGWRLTEEEITSSREGIARDGLSVFTTGNSVDQLIDGEEVMAHLFDDFEAAQAGDFIHGVAFDESLDIILKPRVDDEDWNDHATVGATLVRAIKRGVHVRIMANINAYYPLNAVLFCRRLNDACEDSNCCVPDRRHYSQSGSIHNKMWVIQRNGASTVAYVGGMDICAGRFDTQKHHEDALRREQPPLGVRYYGWHDGMYRIHGPAVVDLARHFWQRWNDPAKPAPSYSPASYDWSAPPVESNAGTLNLQVLRTLSCRAAKENKFYRNFAPRGEYSFREAFVKMVGMAREYLYLEDQFVFYPELLEVVAAALPRIKKLIIVTDSAHSWTISLPAGVSVTMATSMRMYYQHKALSKLHQPIGGVTYKDKVHVYELVRPHYEDTRPEHLVYLHSKNFFADDRYAIVGSHGLERAAFTGDVDVSVGVEDAEGAGPDSFVGRMRRNIWAHHLDTSANDPKLMNPVEAVTVFESQANNEDWRLRRYWPRVDRKGKRWYTEFMYEFLEGDGRCDRSSEMADSLASDAESLGLAEPRNDRVPEYVNGPVIIGMLAGLAVATGLLVWALRE